MQYKKTIYFTVVHYRYSTGQMIKVGKLILYYPKLL
jgi:hypothetical protein